MRKTNTNRKKWGVLSHMVMALGFSGLSLAASPAKKLSSAPMDPEIPPKVIILGDSLTDGYGISKESAYPALLQKRFQQENKNIEIINAGISGSTTASGVSRLKWLLKKPPRVLIIALGANDGLRGFELKATRQNLAEMIKLAQQNKIKVILAGMKLPLNYGAKYRQEFENLFGDLARQYKTGLIPFLLEGVGGEKELNLSDGIHPNEKGHQKMAETVYKYLKDYL